MAYGKYPSKLGVFVRLQIFPRRFFIFYREVTGFPYMFFLKYTYVLYGFPVCF